MALGLGGLDGNVGFGNLSIQFGETDKDMEKSQ